jgi:ribosomal protein L37AE/L43A
MNDTLKEIGIAVIAILIGNYLVSFFPENVTDISPLVILNSQLIQFGLIVILAYVILSWIIGLIQKSLSSSFEPFFTTVTPRRKPEFVDDRYEGSRFGVNWEVLYGRRGYSGERYAYANNPFCPECGAELMEDTVQKRIRSDREIWKCPGCTFTQKRPSKFLYEEKDVVEKMVEREVREQR